MKCLESYTSRHVVVWNKKCAHKLHGIGFLQYVRLETRRAYKPFWERKRVWSMVSLLLKGARVGVINAE